MDNLMKKFTFESVLLQDQVDKELITYMENYIMISVLKKWGQFSLITIDF